MSQYGEVALRAAETLRGSSMDSRDAWRAAARQVIRGSESSRDKKCPEGAFLGLAYAGAIDGVSGAFSSDGGENGLYGRKAWKALLSNPDLAADRDALWELACGDGRKQQNGQLDVVLALWSAGLLRLSRL